MDALRDPWLRLGGLSWGVPLVGMGGAPGIPSRPSRSLQTEPAGALGRLSHSACVSPACRGLLEQVVSCSGLLPAAGLPEEQTVTWFQFHSYLRRQSVSDLEKHFAQLTKEGRGWGGGHRRQHGNDRGQPFTELSVSAL